MAVVRLMQKRDLERVLEMEQAYFSKPWSRKSFCDALDAEGTLYFSAQEGQAVVGYCGFFLSYESADLCNMVVEKHMRQQGIGEQMLRTAFPILRSQGVEQVFLEVRETNLPAICLYEKMNFQIIGKRKGYYSEPVEDAVLMKANI